MGHAKGSLCGKSPYFTLSQKKEAEPQSKVLWVEENLGWWIEKVTHGGGYMHGDLNVTGFSFCNFNNVSSIDPIYLKPYCKNMTYV